MGQTHQLRQDGVTRDGAAWPWVLAWASATTLKSWCCAWTRDCACTTLCKSRGSGGWVKDHGAARCTLGWGCRFDRYPRRGGEFREQLSGGDLGRDAHPRKFAAWDGSRETPKASPPRARRRRKFLKARGTNAQVAKPWCRSKTTPTTCGSVACATTTSASGAMRISACCSTKGSAGRLHPS